MAKCSECGKETCLQVKGVPFCLDCMERIHRIQSATLRDLDRQINHCASMIEMSMGFPQGFLIPRVPVTEPLIQGDNMTFNNINVDRSTIGAINTGSIAKLDVAIGQMQNGSQPELAEGIKRLTEAVINSNELGEESKKEVVDQLSFLGEEAANPTEKKGSSILKPILAALGALLVNVDKLKTLWEWVAPMLQKALNLH
jgi:hypothetical protein